MKGNSCLLLLLLLHCPLSELLLLLLLLLLLTVSRLLFGCRWLLDRQEQLELCRQLILAVQTVREVNPSNATVCVNLNSQGLYIVGPVCTPRKVGQVELYLVPSLVQSHRHRADEGLNAGSRLVVASPEATSDILVVKHLK